MAFLPVSCIFVSFIHEAATAPRQRGVVAARRWKCFKTLKFSNNLKSIPYETSISGHSPAAGGHRRRPNKNRKLACDAHEQPQPIPGLKFGAAPPARPVPAEQPPRKFDPDKPGADEKGLQSGYLLYLAALEAYNPNVYLEELEYIYRYKGEKPLTEEQLKYLLRLLELRPEYGGGYNTLGYNYMALQEMDKAKAAFEKYIELAPNEPNAYDSMGEHYLNTGNYAKSAEYYDRAVALGMEGSKKGAEKARAAME